MAWAANRFWEEAVKRGYSHAAMTRVGNKMVALIIMTWLLLLPETLICYKS